MKNECDIVQDLLFSYKDGCLKQGSKEFVEKHLKKCDECAKIYAEMNNEDDEIITTGSNYSCKNFIIKRFSISAYYIVIYVQR